MEIVTLEVTGPVTARESNAKNSSAAIWLSKANSI